MASALGTFPAKAVGDVERSAGASERRSKMRRRSRLARVSKVLPFAAVVFFAAVSVVGLQAAHRAYTAPCASEGATPHARPCADGGTAAHCGDLL